MRSAALVVLCSLGCVRVSVLAETNRVPVAQAGDDVVVVGGAQVILRGGGIDDDGDDLTYLWGQLAGPTLAVSGLGSPELTFQAPEATTTLVFQLVVDDGYEASVPDLVQVQVTFNIPPVALPPLLVQTPATVPVRLEGAGADGDGDPVATYTWSVDVGPPGVDLSGLLSDADVRAPFFTPPRKGDYYVSLVVNDGLADSEPSPCVVSALNRPPEARLEVTAVPGPTVRYTLAASASSDADLDLLIDYDWSITATPAGGLAAFIGDPQGFASATVELSGHGVYEVSLTVTDADGAQSEPAFVLLSANQAPVLTLLRSRAVVSSAGLVTELEAVASDPDGEPVSVLWTRESGAPVFPPTLLGEQPTFEAPAFSQLLAAGEGATSAVYRVTASDGLVESVPATVELFVLPDESEFLILASGPSATTDPSCGTLAEPCATIAAAYAALDVGGGVGDGRDLLVASGTYTYGYPHLNGTEPPPPGHSLHWLGGTSIYGGRDPQTFAPGGSSTWNIAATGGDCLLGLTGLALSSRSGDDVTVADLTIGFSAACGNYGNLRTVYCLDCRASLSRLTILGPTANAGGDRTGVGVVGANAAPSLSRLSIDVGDTLGWDSGVRVGSGAEVLISDSFIHVEATDGAAVRVEGGQATVRRSTLVVGGPFGGAGNEGALVVTAAGSAAVESSALAMIGKPNASVIRVNSGAATLSFNTLVGSGSSGADTGAGIYALASVLAYGNLVSGAALGLHLANAAAKGSGLHANAVSAVGGVLLRCDAADATSSADVNAAGGQGCNTTSNPWTLNIAASCPLLGVGAYDYRLNASEPNLCVGAGPASTPIGLAPSLDLDGVPRPNPPSLGADEPGP